VTLCRVVQCCAVFGVAAGKVFIFGLLKFVGGNAMFFQPDSVIKHFVIKWPKHMKSVTDF
jgi:hypothetical protein